VWNKIVKGKPRLMIKIKKVIYVGYVMCKCK
jgi:hypothetical protein